MLLLFELAPPWAGAGEGNAVGMLLVRRCDDGDGEYGGCGVVLAIFEVVGGLAARRGWVAVEGTVNRGLEMYEFRVG